ncbi:RsfA family transcriptional regulator [Paenactinomyces guangxiensis]|uniref:RsfA family transcriptional regulator n=1 Tax=Paenactinomyces guangxiensis TaxID=1490290 RepID=A0A7W2A8K3_9BACL|nr:RsfA family transcriptional regulator [Paenactinomyces guangxiensis]MBA4494269.1 RsfA family transcriptional regulator [Paenactinomyces guangxiensis]MBH8590763.1 RsfA family transcriptional regulator [Paenactinomyces guangxiensis]
MAVKRQDAWTDEDDMILAEVTLRHIRDGSTQLSAFEEVAEKLGRTPAACGFRWNSSVRKKYEAAIQIAKSQRQKKSQERGRISAYRSFQEDFSSTNDSVYSLDNIIRFLRQHKNEVNELRKQQKQMEKELEEREVHMKKLERENMEMKNQLNHVQSDYRLVNDDYRTLVQIMERARKMALLDEEDSTGKTKFRMEENGNLERVDK